MQKAGAFFLSVCLLLAQGLFIFAQEAEPGEAVPGEAMPGEMEPGEAMPGIGGEVPAEPGWDTYIQSLYSRGDKNVTISLGLIFPLAFVNRGEVLPMQMIPVGGTGSLAYNYFFDSHFFMGGEVGLMFIGTRRKNTFLSFPFGLRGGGQFIIGRFEFPLSLSIGLAPQRYLDETYFGMYLRPSVAAFFRLSPEWSFGVNTGWWWIPQWPKEKKHSVDGHFLDFTLSARFHF
jgi:hypothetical protein